MRVILAKKFGFCFGVKRAIEKVEKEAKKSKNIFTFGPLIHNHQFIEKLEREGIKVIENLDQVKSGMTVAIRSHGLPPDTKEEIRKKGAKIIDGTCPKVTLIHILAKKLENKGRKVIIIGNKNHPEIIGILGNIKDGQVIFSKEDIDKLPDFDKVAVVSQTTEEVEKFEEFTKKLKEKYKDIEIYNTICESTNDNQAEAVKLARTVDCMIVIGGKHSSNTKHLADVCKKIIKTYHIETEKELVAKWFKDIKKVGVTAGASVPDYIIDEVILSLKKINGKNFS